MVFKFKGSRTLAQATDSHENGFNLVRLLCALLVMVYHAYQANLVQGRPDPLSALVAPHTDLGGMAVGVFFIISGIFVTQSWMRDPHLARFAVRRIARILPGLFVCLLLSMLIGVIWFSQQGWRGLGEWAPWRFVLSGSFLHGLQYIIPQDVQRIDGVLGGLGLNNPLWSLYWEARMYVMVALLGVAAILPMRTWMRACAIFLLLAANLFPTVLDGYIWETRIWSLFLAGMLLHTLAPTVRVGLPQIGCALALIALNWTRWLDQTQSGLTWFGIALVMGALALWLGTARFEGLRHVRSHDYSYGIYIYHWPVLMMLRSAQPSLDALALLGAALLVTVPLAVLSWHWVEAPAVRLVRRWLKR